VSIEDDIKLLERAALLLRSDQNSIINDLLRKGWTVTMVWNTDLCMYVVELRDHNGSKYGGASEHSVQGALARAVLRMPV
jgi:hypothetical protein